MELATTIHDPAFERSKSEKVNYEALYKAYSVAMYNTCLRIVNNVADAEDILQESFCDAFRQFHKLEDKGAFGGWMKKIVINKSINTITRRKIKWIHLEESEALHLSDEEPLDEQEIQFRVSEIKKAIQQLPDGYRTILCLRLFEDYKHDEVAGLLKISSGTARTQYIRGKRKLLELLKQKNLS